MLEWWWAYLALGAFVGFFAGLLGIGGGAAMVPVLIVQARLATKWFLNCRWVRKFLLKTGKR